MVLATKQVQMDVMQGSEHERQVEQTHKICSVPHKDNIRCSLWRSFALNGIVIQLVTCNVYSSEHMIINGHEQTKVCVYTTVMQGVVRRGINQVLHAWNIHEPSREELKVAVTN